MFLFDVCFLKHNIIYLDTSGLSGGNLIFKAFWVIINDCVYKLEMITTFYFLLLWEYW